MSFSDIEKKFLSSASTSVILPQNTQVSPAQAIQDGSGEITLQEIKQRDTLFFDEILTIYVVLSVPRCSEDDLKSYLSRLQLKVEVWTTSETQVSERSTSGPNARELVLTETIKHDEDPIVLISQNEADEEVYLNLLWEAQVKVIKPRTRLQAAHLTFVPVALVSPLEVVKASETFLEPFQPQIANLFEPLRGSRGFEVEPPYLPISRLDAVLPESPQDDNSFHLKSIHSPSILTHLAFVTRLRLSKVGSGFSSSPSTIASLEIEMIPFLDVRGQIDAADTSLRKGRVDSLMEKMLPMLCQSRDCITLLYKLQQARSDDDRFQPSPISSIDVVLMTIKVKLNLSDECQSIIEMQWTTNIDFGQLLSNTPNMPASAIQQLAGPSKQSQDKSNHNGAPSINMSLQPVLQAGEHNNIITISFAAADEAVKIGIPFSWQVLIVNKSTKHVKLAIIPLPRIPKATSQAQQYAKRHATRSSIASLHPSEKTTGDKLPSDVAQAVVDENVIYAMQHSGAVPPATDLMSLTPELRIGPLGPGQCHECEIRFVAFRKGAFTLDAIRVVDLVKEMEQGHGGSGAVMDIRDLPDVIVEDNNY